MDPQVGGVAVFDAAAELLVVDDEMLLLVDESVEKLDVSLDIELDDPLDIVLGIDVAETDVSLDIELEDSPDVELETNVVELDVSLVVLETLLEVAVVDSTAELVEDEEVSLGVALLLIELEVLAIDVLLFDLVYDLNVSVDLVLVGLTYDLVDDGFLVLVAFVKVLIDDVFFVEVLVDIGFTVVLDEGLVDPLHIPHGS